MLNANIVIVGAIVALAVIYFLPHLNMAGRKAFGWNANASLARSVWRA
jgi:hypothetical protein